MILCSIYEVPSWDWKVDCFVFRRWYFLRVERLMSASRSLFCCCRFHGKSFLLPSFIWQFIVPLWDDKLWQTMFFFGGEQFRESTPHLKKTHGPKWQACYVRFSEVYLHGHPTCVVIACPSGNRVDERLAPSLRHPWKPDDHPFGKGKHLLNLLDFGFQPSVFHGCTCCIGWFV